MSARTAGRRRRLDAELVRRGLTPSRTVAQRLVEHGRVRVGGAPATKAAALVAPSEALTVLPAADDYVSRGGHKLRAALDAFGVEVAGRLCLDAGASTGGFTDVLLRRGAARVTAVDVGYGQLAWSLRADDRVVLLERTNVRHLRPADVPPPPPDLLVADLSFVSLTLALPALRTLGAAGADFVLLVKPQFEAGPERVGRGGVVRDPQVWSEALGAVVTCGSELGLRLLAAAPSPLRGPAGNVEFFVHLREGAHDDPGGRIDAAVRAAAAGRLR